jgi:hypothetical protein
MNNISPTWPKFNVSVRYLKPDSLRYCEQYTLYHWKGIIDKKMTSENARKLRSLKRTSALSPSASDIDNLTPFMQGLVGGRIKERTPPRNETNAPPRKMKGDKSKFCKPKNFDPTTEKTPDETQPNVPNTLMRGYMISLALAIAIEAVRDHVGI